MPYIQEQKEKTLGNTYSSLLLLIEKAEYLACLLSLNFSYPYEHCRNLSFTAKKTNCEGKYFCVTYGLKQQEVSI